MAIFDAAAATASYLHSVNPAREAKAIAYTHGSHWLQLWDWLATILAAALVLKSGRLARLSAKIQSKRSRPNLVAFACVALLAISTWVIRLPWTIYSDWARERAYGLSAQSLGAWLTQNAISTVFSAVFIGAVAVPVYALMRRMGRRWPLWGSVIVAIFSFLAVVVAPVAIGPIFNSSHPAPNGPTRMAVEELATRAGIPSGHIVVVDASQQSNRYTATVVGGPGFATIELSDTMISSGADIAEIRAVVAHEIGHYTHYHLLLLAVLLWFLVTIGLVVVDRCFPTVAHRVSGGIPAHVGDPTLAPIIQILLATFMLLTSPIIVSVERVIESDADSYGLALANEPDGAAKSLVRTVDFRASDPGPLEETLFYDHPSIAHRIRAAMEWKAEHLDLTRGPNPPVTQLVPANTNPRD